MRGCACPSERHRDARAEIEVFLARLVPHAAALARAPGTAENGRTSAARIRWKRASVSGAVVSLVHGGIGRKAHSPQIGASPDQPARNFRRSPCNPPRAGLRQALFHLRRRVERHRVEHSYIPAAADAVLDHPGACIRACGWRSVPTGQPGHADVTHGLAGSRAGSTPDGRMLGHLRVEQDHVNVMMKRSVREFCARPPPLITRQRSSDRGTSPCARRRLAA